MGRDALVEFIEKELSQLKPIGDERYVFGLIDAYKKVLDKLKE